MHIINEYHPSAEELARAGVLFLEKQPLIGFIIWVINVFAMLVFLIIILAMVVTKQVLWQQCLAVLLTGFWLFGRKPFNTWLFTKSMQGHITTRSNLKLDISLNGIRWEGKKLRSGSISYRDLKWVIKVKNGYILPNRVNRFLWIPDHGFQSRTGSKDFMKLIIEKKVPLRVYDKWSC